MRCIFGLCAVAVLVVGCNHHPSGNMTSTGATADSLVLERSRCFGACPAYRLSLRADGVVSYASRAPRDPAPVRSGTISPGQFGWLVREAQQNGFTALPPVIADDTTLCPLRATDHSTVTVTLFRADTVTKVVDYLGCYTTTNLTVTPRLARLRHLESQIDSVARSDRWTHSTTTR